MKTLSRYKGYLVALVSLALLVAIVINLRWDLFQIKNIGVQPNDSEVQAGLYENIYKDLQPQLSEYQGKYIWEVSLSELSQVMKKDKRIRDAKIKRLLSGKIEIKITPHHPVYVLLHEQKFYPVARDGSLMPATTRVPDLPVLRGKVFFSSKVKRLEVINLIDGLPEEGEFQRANVSEILFQKKMGYRLILTKTATEVRLGDKDFAKRASYVGRVLSYLSSQQMQGRVIDARFTKKVVVRLRNRP